MVIATALLLFNQYSNDSPVGNQETSGNERNTNVDPAGDVPRGAEEFNRKISKIIYTKHARCRMKCRHIDDSEVKEILQTGRINYSKSEPAARPDPKYALEGRTHDDQQVRIIFAPADKGMVVITVIDLEKEWSCNCK